MSEEYIRKMANITKLVSHTHLYKGEKGALRLAREVGSALRDSPRKKALELVRISYDICVVGYSLSPPIDKKVWDDEVMKSLTKYD